MSLGLLNLPDELLLNISKRFVSNLPAPSYSRQHCATHEDDLIIGTRLALLALTKTCRRLNAIATPTLYQNIRVQDFKTLYRLVNTLLEEPYLAKYVRALGIFINILWSTSRETNSVACRTLIQTLMSDNAGRLYRHFTENARPFSGLFQFRSALRNALGNKGRVSLVYFPEAMCLLLLIFTSNLDTLHLICPDCPHLIGNFDFLTWAIADAGRSPVDGQEGILPRLRTLRLIADPVRNEAMIKPMEPESFMQGRVLKHVELYGPSLLESYIDTVPNPQAWAGLWKDVETLRIEDAYIDAAWLYRLCVEARPPLKHLEIRNSPCQKDLEEDSRQVDGGLNEVLNLCKATLQILRVDLDHGPGDEPNLGPQGKLTCIASMDALKVLSIQTRHLFDSLHDMAESNGCIRDRIPPSLEQLHLLEYADACSEIDPWDPPESLDDIGDDDWYGNWVAKGLLELAFDSAERLPRLERVSLSVSTFYCDSWKGFLAALDARVTFIWEVLEDPASVARMSLSLKRSKGHLV
ncbi:hypothetical protein VTJ83DRAFT_6229 [Remersonia thermophila]|uniref:F-box domain-containing protein n=1 Tax=Remersonia thermophila TaxID=72144 RepID=A0ABR4D536_9PEZI